MSGPPRSGAHGAGPGPVPGRGPLAGVPRWVKVFAAVLIALLLVVVVLHLTGNSLGGPGTHGAASDQGAWTDRGGVSAAQFAARLTEHQPWSLGPTGAT